MSFKAGNLFVLAYANNFTMWHYKTEDSLHDIIANHYFNKASYLLSKNDLIIVNTKDYNTSLWVKDNYTIDIPGSSPTQVVVVTEEASK